MAFSASGAAAGASAGAAVGSVVPGIGTAVGGAVGALAGAFMGGGSSGSGTGAGGAAATPAAAQAAAMGSGIDGSAWVVNFGNGNTTTLDNRQDKTIRSTGPVADANPTAGAARYAPYLDGGYGTSYADPLGLSSLGLGGIPPFVWLALGAAVLIRMTKKKG